MLSGLTLKAAVQIINIELNSFILLALIILYILFNCIISSKCNLKWDFFQSIEKTPGHAVKCTITEFLRVYFYSVTMFVMNEKNCLRLLCVIKKMVFIRHTHEKNKQNKTLFQLQLTCFTCNPQFFFKKKFFFNKNFILKQYVSTTIPAFSVVTSTKTLVTLIVNKKFYFRLISC